MRKPMLFSMGFFDTIRQGSNPALLRNQRVYHKSGFNSAKSSTYLFYNNHTLGVCNFTIDD